MNSPESRRIRSAGGKKKRSIMERRLLFLANATLLSVNLAMTRSDQSGPARQPDKPAVFHSADATAEKKGLTPVDEDRIFPLSPEKPGEDLKLRKKLMETLEPNVIEPVYKLPPKKNDAGSEAIRL